MSHRSVGLLAVIAVVLAAHPAAATSPRPATPVQIVKAFFADLNANRIDKAMSYVSPKAVFDEPVGRYTGRAAIRGFLQRHASKGIVYHHTNFRVHDGRVVYDFRITQYPYGIIASGNNGLTVVKNGKIVFDGTTEAKP